MTPPIVADAGPLIGLARAGLLDVLPQLYRSVEVPPAVARELRLGEDRPGSRALRQAKTAGWLVERELERPERLGELLVILDPGEAEAILLARERRSRFLLVDERRARALARRRSVPVVGVGGVLIAAKERGLLSDVGRALQGLTEVGYRLSSELRAEILSRAGESL